MIGDDPHTVQRSPAFTLPYMGFPGSGHRPVAATPPASSATGTPAQHSTYSNPDAAVRFQGHFAGPAYAGDGSDGGGDLTPSTRPAVPVRELAIAAVLAVAVALILHKVRRKRAS